MTGNEEEHSGEHLVTAEESKRDTATAITAGRQACLSKVLDNELKDHGKIPEERKQGGNDSSLVIENNANPGGNTRSTAVVVESPDHLPT